MVLQNIWNRLIRQLEYSRQRICAISPRGCNVGLLRYRNQAHAAVDTRRMSMAVCRRTHKDPAIPEVQLTEAWMVSEEDVLDASTIVPLCCPMTE
jgi:hypothetical protein